MFQNQLKMRFGTLLAVVPAVLVILAGAFFSTPAMAQHKTYVVKMVMTKNVQFTYEPKILTVHVGDTVEWDDVDIYQHDAVSTDHKNFRSPMLRPKQTWTYKATKVGTFPYICTIHPHMKGVLIVK